MVAFHSMLTNVVSPIRVARIQEHTEMPAVVDVKVCATLSYSSGFVVSKTDIMV